MSAPSLQLSHRNRYILAALGLILLIVLVRTAWVGDDAYITFRTVDNIVHGYGPVWNIDERVQSYTHPLWMLLMTLFCFITREVYFTSIILSIVLTISAALVLVFKIARTALAAIAGVIFLILSKAFMEYSTSGLENALAHFLVAIFFWAYLEHERENRSLFWPGLWAALVILTRTDFGVLVMPPLAYLFIRRPGWRPFGTLVLGLLPLAAWHLWSTWYYGFPFPNTAYAKLNTGVLADDLIRQGQKYFKNLWDRSTSTAYVIIWAAVGTVWRHDKKYLAAIAGLLMYCLYVLRVGGDFMSGRFFTVPFFVALVLIVRFHVNSGGMRWLALIPAAAVVFVGLIRPHAPLFTGSDYGRGDEIKEWDSGISDERAGYFQFTGLVSQGPDAADPHHFWIQQALRFKAAGDTTVAVNGIGMIGYTAGPRVHIVDLHALADPLLARLPISTPKRWRVGHFGRDLPTGYLESAGNEQNLITDTNLAAYYDTLRLITRGDLWDSNRLRAILRMNLGKYNYLVQRYLDRPRYFLTYADASVVKARGTAFDCNGCFVISKTGLVIQLDSLVHDSLLETGLDNNDSYEFTFLKGTEVAGRLIKRDHWIREGGLVVDTLYVPGWIRDRGYDQIQIRPVAGDGSYGVGHIRFIGSDRAKR